MVGRRRRFAERSCGGGTGSPFNYIFQVPKKIPARTDLDLRVLTVSATADVAGGWEMLIVKD